MKKERKKERKKPYVLNPASCIQLMIRSVALKAAGLKNVLSRYPSRSET